MSFLYHISEVDRLTRADSTKVVLTTLSEEKLEIKKSQKCLPKNDRESLIYISITQNLASFSVSFSRTSTGISG